MNRPRNRQQRQPRQSSGQGQPRAERQYPSSVPNVQQVQPGASVSIVLKADQPTGREVQGVVQDLLTRGNHPRGIKVRLRDGRVGRVQRMAGDGVGVQVEPTIPGYSVDGAREPTARRERDEGQQYTEPPARTLQDFMPLPSRNGGELPTRPPAEVVFSTATAKCPICGLFEGDEAAVSHHLESHF